MVVESYHATTPCLCVHMTIYGTTTTTATTATATTTTTTPTTPTTTTTTPTTITTLNYIQGNSCP